MAVCPRLRFLSRDKAGCMWRGLRRWLRKHSKSIRSKRALTPLSPASLLPALIALSGFLLMLPQSEVLATDTSEPGPRDDYAGSAACAGCHRDESEAWTRSQHARAMQAATEASVLGDFNNAQAQHFSSKARFYRKDGRFFVETEAMDGKQAEFAVKYTFGFDPLQQYLVEFP